MNTLIDGLIVEDQDHDTKVARYLAFDVIFLEGVPTWQKKLEKRLQCLQNEIIVPRKNVRLVFVCRHRLTTKSSLIDTTL